jgi:hypothetical protein
MAREIINVGSTANDGTGDGLRTAYIKCNDNFQELYNTTQTPVQIENGTSNMAVAASANVTVSIAGSSNVVNFAGSITEFTGNADISGDLAIGNSLTITQDVTVGDQLIIPGTVGSNIIPDGNNTRDLGSSSARFKDIYLSGSSIVLGDIVLKAGTGNVLDIFGADGTTPGTVSPTVTNGTSNIAIPSTNGNVEISVNGVNDILVASDAGANITGYISATGLVSAGTTITATGNVAGGNITTVGDVTATGNVSGAFVIGDGGFLSNVTAASNVAVTQIANGTSVVGIASSGGNIEITSGGILIFESDGATAQYNVPLVFGSSNVVTTGNVSGGNVLATDAVIATGNVTGGNVTTAGLIDATGNITSGANIAATNFIGNGSFLTGIDSSGISNGTSNISVASSANITASVTGNTVTIFTASGQEVTGTISATANVDANKISVTDTMVAGGTVTGGNLHTTGQITDGTMIIQTGSLTSVGNIAAANVNLSGLADVTGNIDGGNINTAGAVVATGNISGGNINTPSGKVVAADVEATIGIFSTLANITAATASTSTTTGSLKTAGGLGVVGNAHVGGTINGTLNNTLTMATSGTGLSGSATYNNSGAATFTVTSNATNSNTGSTVVARDGSGNFSAGTITATLTGQASTIASQANSATITAASTNTANQIVLRDANGSFAANVVTALSTSAQYADIAEMYSSDHPHEPGTVLEFGGEAEVKRSSQDATPRVAGVVSTKPAHLMNNKQGGVAVALVGRVPTHVVGPVRKGDLMVATSDGRARAEANPAMGTVIGKALEDFDDAQGTIEVVVGRL